MPFKMSKCPWNLLLFMEPPLVVELRRTRLMPLATIPDPKKAVPLAQSLLDGGVKFIEITFRNEFAALAMQQLTDAGIKIHSGAGTVRTVEQAKAAKKAGAQFLVAPGFGEGVVKFALEQGIPIFPGVDSTLGIEKALEYNLKVIKCFPASVIGGIEWLKAIHGPYGDIGFIPTGGVTLENIREYLSLRNVVAAGGSFVIPADLLKAGKFSEITNICRRAVAIVDEINKNNPPK